MRRGIVMVFVAFLFVGATKDPGRTGRTEASFLMDYVNIRYPKEQFDRFLYVQIKQQKMYLVENGRFTKAYTVSTSAKGMGMIENSFQTPHGLHKIVGKVGAGAPVGGILKGTSYTGKTTPIYTDERIVEGDLVTTRAMRLAGLERGKNKGRKRGKVVDSYRRHIFIHGTPEEGRLGTPASHGCVRMKNTDIIELFDNVDKGLLVVILNL